MKTRLQRHALGWSRRSQDQQLPARQLCGACALISSGINTHHFRQLEGAEDHVVDVMSWASTRVDCAAASTPGQREAEFGRWRAVPVKVLNSPSKGALQAAAVAAVAQEGNVAGLQADRPAQ